MSVRLRSAVGWLAGTAAAAAAAYGSSAVLSWLRYGHRVESDNVTHDQLLDLFMPCYDIVERHQIQIAAPADLVMAQAREMDIADNPIARAIFKTRELVMRGTAVQRHSRGVIAETMALGWGILAEVPGHEIVMGAVTKPWEANVTFTALPPDRFRAFADPDFVKIAWTLRADPTGPSTAVFRTETRAVATDPAARSRFRRYWALVSPGVWLIRRLSLKPLKRKTERAFRRSEAGIGLPQAARERTEKAA